MCMLCIYWLNGNIHKRTGWEYMDRFERIQKVKLAMLSMQRDAWEQGVAAQAFLEMRETSWVRLFAREAALRQGEDGRLALTYSTNGITEPAANGEAVLAAAAETGDPDLKRAAGRMADWLLRGAPRADTGAICHVMGTRQVWVDSMYMSPPFLAIAGYPGEAVRQLEAYRKILYDEQKRLYSHSWDDDRKEFVRSAFWSVGNGWAAAGITRVIAALPEGSPVEKKALVEHLIELIDSCLSYRRKDGFFHDILDDPGSFAEVNLSQMLAYCIYRGVQRGYLGREYLEKADFMREAVYGKVDADGLVRGVCGAPFFDRPGTATEGQAFFLLMEAAYKDLS
jgi:unsaturated rhamnogalacturonyl hydrolase